MQLQGDGDYVHRSKIDATLRQPGPVQTLRSENLLDQRRLEGAQLGRANGWGRVVNDEDASVRLLLFVQIDRYLCAFVSRSISETVIQQVQGTVSSPESNCGR